MKVKVSNSAIKDMTNMNFDEKKEFFEVLNDAEILVKIGEEAEKFKTKNINTFSYKLSSFTFKGNLQKDDICLIDEIQK